MQRSMMDTSLYIWYEGSMSRYVSHPSMESGLTKTDQRSVSGFPSTTASAVTEIVCPSAPSRKAFQAPRRHSTSAPRIVTDLSPRVKVVFAFRTSGIAYRKLSGAMFAGMVTSL